MNDTDLSEGKPENTNKLSQLEGDQSDFGLICSFIRLMGKTSGLATKAGTRTADGILELPSSLRSPRSNGSSSLTTQAKKLAEGVSDVYTGVGKNVSRLDQAAARAANGAISITGQSVVMTLKGAGKATAWTGKGIIGSVKLLNPISWRNKLCPCRAAESQKPNKKNMLLRKPEKPKSSFWRGRKRQEITPVQESRPVESNTAKTVTPSTPPAPVTKPKPKPFFKPKPTQRRSASLPMPTHAEIDAATFAGHTQKVKFSRAFDNLNTEDEHVRARSATELGAINHILSVRALSSHLSVESSAKVRKECVSSLTTLEIEEGLPAIIQALTDSASAVRLTAVHGVYNLAGAAGAIKLVAMLSDADPGVRRRAATCIGWLQQKELAPELVPLLHDDMAYVRSGTLDALGSLRSPAVIGEVIELLNDPEEEVRKKAFEVLKTITGKEMVKRYPASEDKRELMIARWRAWHKEELAQ
ncbi:HEAT repeat domain-containing protein [Oligoflexia bacterium]|nr:HEAT repeat domain-containing protein [Oligoflexia bacterium]